MDPWYSKFECGVCYSKLSDHQKLSCPHSFCGECVKRVVERRLYFTDNWLEIKDVIKCPHCRETSDFIPGFENLTAKSLNQELKVRREKLQSSPSSICSLQCVAELFRNCIDCKIVFCSKCSDEEHAEHKVVSCAEKAEEERDRLSKIVDKYKVHVKLCTEIQSYVESKTSVREEIKQFYDYMDNTNALKNLRSFITYAKQILEQPDEVVACVGQDIPEDFDDDEIICQVESVHLYVENPGSKKKLDKKARRRPMGYNVKEKQSKRPLMIAVAVLACIALVWLYTYSDMPAQTLKLEKISSFSIPGLRGITIDKITAPRLLISIANRRKPLKMYDYHGNYLFTIDNSVGLSGDYYHSLAMDVNKGYFIVPDKDKVVLIKPDGQSLMFEEFARMKGVSFLPRNGRYIFTDYKHNQVQFAELQLFRSESKLKSLNGWGNAEIGEFFTKPKYVASYWAGEQRFATSNSKSNSVHVFDVEGKNVHKYQSWAQFSPFINKPTSRTSLSNPKGLVYDIDGGILVCNSDYSQVVRYWNRRENEYYAVVLDAEDLNYEHPALIDYFYDRTSGESTGYLMVATQEETVFIFKYNIELYTKQQSELRFKGLCTV